jgi:hypothetical protein
MDTQKLMHSLKVNFVAIASFRRKPESSKITRSWMPVEDPDRGGDQACPQLYWGFGMTTWGLFTIDKEYPSAW